MQGNQRFKQIQLVKFDSETWGFYALCDVSAYDVEMVTYILVP